MTREVRETWSRDGLLPSTFQQAPFKRIDLSYHDACLTTAYGCRVARRFAQGRGPTVLGVVISCRKVLQPQTTTTLRMLFSKRQYYEEGTELIVCRWFAVAQRLHAAQVGPDPIT